LLPPPPPELANRNRVQSTNDTAFVESSAAAIDTADAINSIKQGVMIGIIVAAVFGFCVIVCICGWFLRTSRVLTWALQFCGTRKTRARRPKLTTTDKYRIFL
jgi:hypothetical protein